MSRMVAAGLLQDRQRRRRPARRRFRSVSAAGEPRSGRKGYARRCAASWPKMHRARAGFPRLARLIYLPRCHHRHHRHHRHNRHHRHAAARRLCSGLSSCMMRAHRVTLRRGVAPSSESDHCLQVTHNTHNKSIRSVRSHPTPSWPSRLPCGVRKIRPNFSSVRPSL
jgi:hypothetical protein